MTKPIKPKEVLARIGVHLQSPRENRQARNALDAFGYATITVRVSDGKLMWQTPLARELLLQYYGTGAPKTPEPVLTWLRHNLAMPNGRSSRRSPLHRQFEAKSEPPRSRTVCRSLPPEGALRLRPGGAGSSAPAGREGAFGPPAPDWRA